MAPLARAVGRVTHASVAPGNAIEPLVGGDEAYPAMLAAIDEARSTVALSTYIFDHDAAGLLFVDALARAVQRGVQVRVLIDGAGSRYSKPRIPSVLKRHGVIVAEFLSTLTPLRMPYLNLRNHRKILVVDGKVGFTGGMNLRQGHRLSAQPPHPVQDLHFRVRGPVVRHLLEAFAKDWSFTTGEHLEGETWYPVLEVVGDVAARGVPDGPDDDFERLHWTLLAALAHARRRVRVVTPYFLPDRPLISALNVAALRGVRVDIVLPEQNNLRIVGWAMRARLHNVMEFGCRVWLTPPPFDHTKLMIVDDGWVLFGSGNWDPRSLRLNFEYNVECYDRELAAALDELVQEKIDRGRPLSAEELHGRSLPVKLRDGVAWLFSPYL
jgi:cardiolipin synthase